MLSSLFDLFGPAREINVGQHSFDTTPCSLFYPIEDSKLGLMGRNMTQISSSSCKKLENGI